MLRTALTFTLFTLCLGTFAEEVIPEDDKIESAALKKHFERLAGEMMKMKEKLPPGIKEDDLKKSLLETAVQHKLLLVTAKEEKQFASGKFDDEGNAAKMKEAINLVTLNQVTVSLPLVYAINEFKEGNLKGGLLEVSTRMIEDRVTRAKAARTAPQKQ
jgi:hypothetical protein